MTTADKSNSLDPLNWGGASWEGAVNWPERAGSRAIDLSVRLEAGIPRHPNHPPYSLTMTGMHGSGGGYPNGISATAEMITTGGHVGTHVDALGHVALDGCIYGDRDIIDKQSWSGGVGVGSVEELPPLIGPGHLVDAPALFGRDLTPADGIGADEFEAWFSDHPRPEKDSIVVVRTGQMKHWRDPHRFLGTGKGVPGVSLSGAQWLSEVGVRATGTDTMNFEHKPDPAVVAMDAHVHLLVEKGIPIIEFLDLEAAAAARAYEFFFVAAALRLGGASGSPIRALALL